MPHGHKHRDLAARSCANPVRSCSKCPARPAKRPRAGASFLRRKVASASPMAEGLLDLTEEDIQALGSYVQSLN
jgi:hypothetical protein